MIDLHSVTLRYNKNIILKECTYHFDKSNIIGVIAPNGYGKTTLFNSIVDLKKPSNGFIKINQKTIGEDRSSYLKNIFFLESSSNLYNDFSSIEMINYIKYLWKSNSDVDNIIKKLQISSFKYKKIKKLSLGMKQSVLLACAIASQSKVIILDEPFNGLDPMKQEHWIQILRDLKKEGKLIIFSSHDLNKCAEICDKTLFLHDHKLVEYHSKTNHELEIIFKQHFSTHS